MAFEECGVEVIPYPTFSFLKVLSAETVCSDILGNAIDSRNNVDAVVFVDGLYFRGERARVPLSIRRAGLPTILIATDDPYEPVVNAESLYTYRFTNEIRSAGDSVHYLPTATLPMPRLPRQEQHQYDICFLGTVFPDRYETLRQVAQFCEARRLRFLIAGKLLEGSDAFSEFTFTTLRPGTIETAQKLEFYTQSKLVLNLFRESESPADSPGPRIFEVAALGQAALVSGPERSEVRRIFDDSIYHFDDAAQAMHVIDEALTDAEERALKVERARAITEAAHLYRHRVDQLLNDVRRQQTETPSDDSHHHAEKLVWMIGCGRTGSTWLSEMLAELPRMRRWHEPYFGRFLKHVQDRPGEQDRQSSFFARRHQQVWMDGLRDLFFRMVADRYPQFGRHALFVKEVNTPELYPWIQSLFPGARLIHLVRDPFDTLDSYLALQKPGSWNPQFGNRDDPLSDANVRRTADHIRSTMTLAQDVFERFPADSRLEVRYEQLLSNAAPLLLQCGQLVGVEVSEADAAAAVARHDFKNYDKTGDLEFRRRGVAGGWQDSPNFTRSVRRIADSVLGKLRARLGYSAARQSVSSDNSNLTPSAQHDKTHDDLGA